MDGNYLISNGYDHCIKLWDLRQIQCSSVSSPTSRCCMFRKRCEDKSLMTYTGHKVMQTLIRCRFSPLESTGQKYIYSGSFDGSVYSTVAFVLPADCFLVYDLLTGAIVKKVEGHNSVVRDVHWHPFRPEIVSVGVSIHKSSGLTRISGMVRSCVGILNRKSYSRKVIAIPRSNGDCQHSRRIVYVTLYFKELCYSSAFVTTND